MKYQNANSYFFSALSVLTLFSSFVAHAHIENTVISSYNLTTGKNVHYELLVSPRNQNTTVTLVPLEQNNKAASIFKISACINRYTGSSKQGEFHFSAAKAAQNDPRLSNFGTFVTEHNLHTWWIHLNAKQNLLFTQDVGGLLVTDPSTFLFSTKPCQTN
ncbi:hypothetical protein [Citrobacter sp. Res13-Sevr-PEB04-36]|uniref:hypothetical protein n=1 Tax=Citrobacter sp. Res13-Sevr-PEB04-36 TaxID=2777960 RepID=UPI0018AC9396|nr:hypothetical protein [Citrobacter sp. Res13-Sevr-PEB04-36]